MLSCAEPLGKSLPPLVVHSVPETEGSLQRSETESSEVQQSNSEPVQLCTPHRPALQARDHHTSNQHHIHCQMQGEKPHAPDVGKL